MTIIGRFCIVIDAPQRAVWPWVADLAKHADWSPRAYEIELVSGSANHPGSRYRSAGWVPGDRHHVNEVEITEVLPYERFALRADDPMGSFDNCYTLRDLGNGTQVDFELVFPPLHGVAAVMVPVLFPLIGKADIRKRASLLKMKVEAGLSTTGAAGERSERDGSGR